MKNPLKFVQDIYLPGLIHAIIIRSPISCGRLEKINCPVLPPSFQLITAQHIPGENNLANFPVPVLADKNLSYIGQPAAILAGPDETKLEELACDINLEYEEDEPSFYRRDFDSKNIIARREILSGDPDRIFGESEKIVSGNYSTGIQEHWYPEPHAAAVQPSPSFENLTVYTATQWPFHVKHSVARVLGWDSEKITVNQTCLAVHLDGKIWYPSLVACHAALACWVTKSPVKIKLTREEDFLYSPKRNKAEIEIKSALGVKGEITATLMQVNLDMGAEAVFEDELIDHSCLGVLGVYQHHSYKIGGFGIRSNIPAQGPMAGFGLALGFFAAERHISGIADSLDLDPAEWRKNNLLEKYHGFVELIDAVAARSDYYRKRASYELLRKRRREEKRGLSGEPLRGIGISTAFQGNGFINSGENGRGNCSVEVSLDKDGSLEIKTNLLSPGIQETWQNLSQEILGVDPALIRFIDNGIDIPDAGPATLSRNIGLLCRRFEYCCTEIRNLRFRDPLPITVRSSAEITGGNDAFAHPGLAAAVVETEIDPVSLEPAIRSISLVADGGKIISRRRAVYTLRTGIIQALSWACREQLRYEDGKIPIELYRCYDIPFPSVTFPINVDFINTDSEVPKGIGELAFSCIPAAYVQAVSQAMDHHFEKIPLTAREIWEAGILKQTENR